MDDAKRAFLARDLSMSPRDKAKRNRLVRKALRELDRKAHAEYSK